jgi:opacity protein-like surface antigen
MKALLAIVVTILLATNAAAQSKLAFDGPYVGIAFGKNQTSVGEGNALAHYTIDGGNFIGINGQSSKASGLMKGFNVGYDHRINNLVIGGEFSSSTLEGTTNGFAVRSDITTPVANAPISSSTKISSLLIAKSKAGFVLDNKAMVYGMAGLAMGNVKRTILDLSTPVDWWGNDAPLSSSQNKFGYTFGMGAEAMITEQFSLKLEMNYVDLGTISSTYTAPWGGNSNTVSIQQAAKVTNIATTLGLSYKF